MIPKLSVAIAAFLLTIASHASAVEPAWTNIAVKDMCCNGCVKKIAARMYSVRGVKEVRADIEKRTLYVLPQQNATLSPRAMWEAVEKAKEKPIRLAGPSGTFSEKPRF